MSYVIAAPEMMTAAAGDLGNIGSTLVEEHTAAAASTVGLVPAAADEVSAGVAHLFSQYGSGFAALAGKASAFHDQFVHNLKASAGAYTSGEAANAAGLVPYWLSQLFGTVDTLLRSVLPLQLQQLIGSLEYFIALPLILAVLLGSLGFAYLLSQIQQLLAPFGL